MRLINFAVLFCITVLPAYAQHPQQANTPRPDTPFSTKPSVEDRIAAAQRQLKAMQQVHQRLMHASSLRERRSLAGEHSKAMRSALGAMQAIEPTGIEHESAMAAHHLQAQLTMMQMMMRMMIDRIDMLSAPAR